MALNLLIPDINSRPTNTKDAVISILTIQWPLSLKKIYNQIKKQYGYNASYQAVYKSVKELTEDKIITKKDKNYEINIEWVKKLQSFTDIIETNYYAKERIQSLSGLKDTKHKEDIMVLNFETLFDAEKYLYYLMKSELYKKQNESICFQMSHEWRPLFYLRTEFNYYRKLRALGHKFYFICSGDSYLEEINKKFYQSIGVNYKTIKETLPNDTLIFGDYFIHIYTPENLKIQMKKYLKNKDILSLLKEVLEKKSSIRVVITKDKEIAKQLKSQIIAKFK